MIEEIKNKSGKILTGAAFAFFFLITCYKLTNAPLWFDETIEYWYSKIMFGTLPFESAGTVGSVNMYQRIVSTFQPPLYNFLMYFWLKINESEWWFRFFGVVMGFVGNLAIYKTIKKTGNVYVAAISVFFSSCIYELVYYWQECAEYCLMLGTLCWTIYFFVCLIEEQNTKNIMLFIVFSILSVYSHYGAVFPVGTMLVVALIYVLLSKDKKNIITISVSYVVALIVAALPLYFLFLKKQMESQQGGEVTLNAITFDGNIFKDFFSNLSVIVRWNLFSYFEKGFSWAYICIVLIIMIAVVTLAKKRYIWMLAIVNCVTYILYYFAVKVGVYSYGSFGSRYNLFFIPLWVVSTFCFCIELYRVVRNKLPEKIAESRYFYLGVCMIFIFCFCLSSWTLRLQNNWGKENMRDAVKKWLEQEAYNSNTIVYYGGDSGFAYYLRQSDNYSETMEQNVNYMYWYRDRTVEEYTEYVNSVYGNEWPDEVYIIGVHTRDDFNTLASAFTNIGYNREDLFNSSGLLIRLQKNLEVPAE